MKPTDPTPAAAAAPPELPPPRPAGESLRLALLAARRHYRLALACLLVALGAAAVALATRVEAWRSHVVILVQGNARAQALGTPDRTWPREEESPARGVAELVHARENLEGLIDELGLTLPEGEGATEGTAEQRRAADRGALVGLLRERLMPHVAEDESTVSIEAEWTDRDLAVRLASAGARRFLERRRAIEVEALGRTVAVLEEHVEQASREVDAALERAVAEHARSRRTAERALRALARGPADETDRALARLRRDLSANRAAISELEQTHQRRRAGLHAQLEDLQTRYKPDHPALRQAQEELARVAEPGALRELREREQGLLDEYLSRGGKAPEVLESGAVVREAAQLGLQEAQLQQDPRLAHARQRLELAGTHYGALAARLEAARVEHDTARAAFAGRYLVVHPAEAPEAPSSPSGAMVLAAALLGGLLLAGFAVLVAFVRENRLYEPWQLERALGLPVLGEVGAPEPRGSGA